MKAIVIYKSNTGFTKKYAGWIANALACEAVSVENIKGKNLKSYDTLVFGGWLFAGTLQGLKEVKEMLVSFDGKKAVFAVGAMPANAPEVKPALDKFLTGEERKDMGLFYMQGGLNYSKMGFIHKSMMKMMCHMMKKQKGGEMYKTISHSFDAANQAAIEPLIHYIT